MKSKGALDDATMHANALATNERSMEQNVERAKLSAFVVSYNREKIIGTALQALGFVDELILIDKSSTDATVAIAAPLVDRVIVTPLTATVEDTRPFAASLCSHEWILFLDDDECLTPEAVLFIDQELRAPRAEIYRIPQRHHVLGVHDEAAYYWPENQIRLFKKGALEFVPTVHNGFKVISNEEYAIPASTGAAMLHLSHANVAQCIEKTNRYTSQPDRLRMLGESHDIVAFAHKSIDKWVASSRCKEPDSYPMVASLLRFMYDLIDRLKSWEEERGLDGNALFAAICRDLEVRYEAELAHLKRERSAVEAAEPLKPPPPDTPPIDRSVADLVRTNAALVDILRATRLAAESQGERIRSEHSWKLQQIMKSEYEMNQIRASILYGPLLEGMKIESAVRRLVRKLAQRFKSRKDG